jgi:hypothetical protein
LHPIAISACSTAIAGGGMRKALPARISTWHSTTLATPIQFSAVAAPRSAVPLWIRTGIRTMHAG